MSIKEGVDIETENPHLEMYVNETVSRKCRHCAELFIITKNFKSDEHVCDVSFKKVNDIDKFCKMHIIWINNSK